MRTLSTLDLSGNEVGLKTCEALASLLATPGCAITQLLLADNPLGDRGAAALCRRLGEAVSLAEIDLSSTGLGSHALTAASASLAEHPGCPVRAIIHLGNAVGRAATETLQAILVARGGFAAGDPPLDTEDDSAGNADKTGLPAALADREPFNLASLSLTSPQQKGLPSIPQGHGGSPARPTRSQAAAAAAADPAHDAANSAHDAPSPAAPSPLAPAEAEDEPSGSTTVLADAVAANYKVSPIALVSGKSAGLVLGPDAPSAVPLTAPLTRPGTAPPGPARASAASSSGNTSSTGAAISAAANPVIAQNSGRVGLAVVESAAGTIATVTKKPFVAGGNPKSQARRVKPGHSSSAAATAAGASSQPRATPVREPAGTHAAAGAEPAPPVASPWPADADSENVPRSRVVELTRLLAASNKEVVRLRTETQAGSPLPPHEPRDPMQTPASLSRAMLSALAHTHHHQTPGGWQGEDLSAIDVASLGGGIGGGGIGGPAAGPGPSSSSLGLTPGATPAGHLHATPAHVRMTEAVERAEVIQRVRVVSTALKNAVHDMRERSLGAEMRLARLESEQETVWRGFESLAGVVTNLSKEPPKEPASAAEQRFKVDKLTAEVASLRDQLSLVVGLFERQEKEVQQLREQLRRREREDAEGRERDRRKREQQEREEAEARARAKVEQSENGTSKKSKPTKGTKKQIAEAAEGAEEEEEARQAAARRERQEANALRVLALAERVAAEQQRAEGIQSAGMNLNPGQDISQDNQGNEPLPLSWVLPPEDDDDHDDDDDDDDEKE